MLSNSTVTKVLQAESNRKPVSLNGCRADLPWYFWWKKTGVDFCRMHHKFCAQPNEWSEESAVQHVQHFLVVFQPKGAESNLWCSSFESKEGKLSAVDELVTIETSTYHHFVIKHGALEFPHVKKTHKENSLRLCFLRSGVSSNEKMAILS